MKFIVSAFLCLVHGTICFQFRSDVGFKVFYVLELFIVIGAYNFRGKTFKKRLSLDFISQASVSIDFVFNNNCEF